MRVLLVDDDGSSAALIDGLARCGIVADHVTTGAAALATVPPEVILLDPAVLDPGRRGIDLCRRLRRDGEIPLVLLTARGDEAGLLRQLELDADDHLAKPCDLPDLAARVRAAGRRDRPAPAAEPVRRYGPLAIDTRNRQIRLHGVPISLAPKEYDLLVLLAADPGVVVDRRHILETVWEPDFFGPGKTLDFHVASLRRKLGGPGWIENRRGVGFRLVVPA